MTAIKVPVYRNANIGLAKMQPVIFSHGLTGQRNTYSALFMEMASCGYCVFSISHNDRSADYTPSVGLYDVSAPIYTYDVKRMQVTIREHEVQSFANEVTKSGFLGTIAPEWSKSSLTDQLVLMGHSFGGITVYGAAKDCRQAKAIIGIDPWFYPHSKDKIGAADH
jgi:platelet-activating factor acetylhydrolase